MTADMENTPVHNTIHNEDGCERSAKQLIELLLDHGVSLLIIAKDVSCREDQLSEILEGNREADDELVRRLRNRYEHREINYGPHLKDNTRAIEIIVELKRSGLTGVRIGKEADVGGAFICQVLRGKQKASCGLIERLTRFREDYVSARVECLVSETETDLTVLATKKDPSTPLNADTCDKMANAVRRGAVERLIKDRHERIVLENGIPGVVVQVGEDILIVALDRAQCRDAAGDPIPHELEAIGRWFLERARECEKDRKKRTPSEPHPKKW